MSTTFFLQISQASSKKSRTSYDDGWGDYGRATDDYYYEEVKVVKKAAAANKRGKGGYQYDDDEQVRLSLMVLITLERDDNLYAMSISRLQAEGLHRVRVTGKPMLQCRELRQMHNLNRK